MRLENDIVAMRETEICHFWVGRFPEEIAANYFVEDRVNSTRSAFARDQGIEHYDPDFIEHGWGVANTIEELTRDYSYSDQWASELATRAAAAGLGSVNFFVFITADEIKQPRSVQGDGYWLRYLGTIEYRI